MSQYNDHPLIEGLKQTLSYDQTDDVWGSLKQNFSVATPEWRAQSLNGLDQWLAQEDRVTRDHARLLNMRRELGGIHSAMRKVGR
jgi:hypothetical protein